MSPTPPSVNLHASRGNEILIPAILCPALATIIILLRLYTRCVILKTPALDDVFAVLALVFSVGNSVSQGYELKYGFGKHVATLTPAQIVGSLKALYASIIFYNLALTSVKVSIILLYLRLFSSQASNRICYALLAIMAAYGFETLFAGIFTCTPIAFFWNSKIPGGTCIDKTMVYYANAGISIVTDVALLFIPIIFLRHLTMRKLQKVVVIVIVSFGGFACVASVLRLRYLYVSTQSKDPTWDKTPAAYWSTIEINAGIICASLPTLRALASRLFPGMFSYRPQVQTSAVVNTGMARIADLEGTGKPVFESFEREDSEHGKSGDVLQ